MKKKKKKKKKKETVCTPPPTPPPPPPQKKTKKKKQKKKTIGFYILVLSVWYMKYARSAILNKIIVLGYTNKRFVFRYLFR